MANARSCGITPSVGAYLYGWFFQYEYGKRSDWEVVRWWETRRLAYNLIVFIGLILSFTLFTVMSRYGGAAAASVGELGIVPYLGLLLFFNILYTTGWFLEVVVNGLRRNGSGKLGPNVLKFCLLFSLFLLLLPCIRQGITFFAPRG